MPRNTRNSRLAGLDGTSSPSLPLVSSNSHVDQLLLNPSSSDNLLAQLPGGILSCSSVSALPDRGSTSEDSPPDDLVSIGGPSIANSPAPRPDSPIGLSSTVNSQGPAGSSIPRGSSPNWNAESPAYEPTSPRIGAWTLTDSPSVVLPLPQRGTTIESPTQGQQRQQSPCFSDSPAIVAPARIAFPPIRGSRLSEDSTSAPAQQPQSSTSGKRPLSPVTSDSGHSSDSSDGYQTPPRTNWQLRQITMNKPDHEGKANVITAFKRPPILTEGSIDIIVLKEYETACLQYFHDKDIKDSKMVGKILSGLQGTHASNWVSNERTRLVTMSFPDFISEMSRVFLDDDWPQVLSGQLAKMAQHGQDFSVWAFQYFRLAKYLNDTPEKRDNIIKDLRGLMDVYLRHRIDKDKVIKEKTDFFDWVKAVHAEERSIKSDRLHLGNPPSGNLDQYGPVSGGWKPEPMTPWPTRPFRTSTTTPNASGSNTSQVPPAKRFKANDGNSLPTPSLSRQPSNIALNSNGAPSNSSFSYPPALTDQEREFLRNGRGCFKCRRLGADHVAASCPNGPPDGRSYKPITQSTFDAFRRSTSVVASTLAGYDEDSDDNIAAAAFNAYDDEDWTSVSVNFSRPAWFWSAFAVIAGDLLANVRSLLDGGSSVTLCSEEFAIRSGYRRRRLATPFYIKTALHSVKDSNQHRTNRTPFSEYIIVPFSTLNRSWLSRPTIAIIVPSLVNNLDILLGLNFLEDNHIVQDFANRTAFVNGSSIDLMNSEVTPPSKRVAWSRKKQHQLDLIKKAVIKELESVLFSRPVYNEISSSGRLECISWDPLQIISAAIVDLSEKEQMIQLDKQIKEEFADVFGPVPHVDRLPEHDFCRVRLRDPDVVLDARKYSSPRKYREAWNRLLNDHIDAGRIKWSSSQHTSPSFLIPKSDPSALPRWVIDYRKLNSNVVPDKYPLPRVEDILADCARGRYWCKFDMTNAFFQTKVHPDEAHLFATMTPLGAVDWNVMPMGYKNAPAIHQRRMTNALRDHIGKFCHVFIDDCIGWSSTLTQHASHVRLILQACRDNGLFLNGKKSVIATTETKFLGHIVSRDGIKPDGSKIDRVVNWPIPKSVKDVRAFLGLVRYLGAFLPDAAKFTRVLDPLCSDEYKKSFPPWTSKHQQAFDALKNLVTSADCLTTINHENMGNNKVFVTTDASDSRSGAVLSFGPTWETARPVAFYSSTFKGPELNYPIHEKEMLAIIRALKKWRSDLLGFEFFIYTDHRTLEFFHTQKDLSRRQARWMEFLSQYEGKITYVKGKDNSLADALSRTDFPEDPPQSIETTNLKEGDDDFVCVAIVDTNRSPMTLVTHLQTSGNPDDEPSHPSARPSISLSTIDTNVITDIKKGYRSDPWCLKMIESNMSNSIFREQDGLWFLGSRLVIPNVRSIKGAIFRAAHDALGHFGFFKSYEALRHSFYWPKMRKQLETSYIAGCSECQRFKDRTSNGKGPLHPLPVPSDIANCIALDFVGPFPEDNGFDMVLTITDRLGSDIRLIPCNQTDNAERIAILFFSNWYLENGLPIEIISDRDSKWLSEFWSKLHELTGVKLALSSSFHPETDGSSERTNKSMVQALRIMVDRDQKNWSSKLPLVRFAMMNTVNASTGLTPFEVRLGRNVRLVPPFIRKVSDNKVEATVKDFLQDHIDIIAEAKDNLLSAKVEQEHYANKKRGPGDSFEVGDLVLLSTINRRKEFQNHSVRRASKLFPRWEGPYPVTFANTAKSSYTLDLGPNSRTFNTFHVSLLKRWVPNDDTLFPHRSHLRPPPIQFSDGAEEHIIDKILDERRVGKGFQYLVRWKGFGPEDDEWMKSKDLAGTDALKFWLQRSS